MRLINADELLKHIPPEEMCSRMVVANAPTIEKRKTGKWIYTPTEPLGYICSECKEGCCRYNFCPNCGARMSNRC